jgi:MOSC domain-containing protein YiiM
MKILSVNVGLPREVTWQGKLVMTGIFKEPVNAPVRSRAGGATGYEDITDVQNQTVAAFSSITLDMPTIYCYN